MNKDTQVEIIYPSNFWWKHTMSEIGYTEGMTEEEFNAKKYLNNIAIVYILL